jgi:hypothetical protein
MTLRPCRCTRQDWNSVQLGEVREEVVPRSGSERLGGLLSADLSSTYDFSKAPRFVFRARREAHWLERALLGGLGLSAHQHQHQHQQPRLDTDCPRPKPRPPHAREIASARGICIWGYTGSPRWGLANSVPFLATACPPSNAFMTGPPPSHSRPVCARHTRSQAASRHF